MLKDLRTAITEGLVEGERSSSPEEEENQGSLCVGALFSIVSAASGNQKTWCGWKTGRQEEPLLLEVKATST